ncbi:MAG: hypothetical protein KatS3mg077_0759 [Candidatus Binatia bacterium]|nr:MAG: hypothetical protein KatS3mg077_0759 [Candidatus Binatia bacterium]
MSVFPSDVEARDLAIIEHMMATGEIVAAQMPSKHFWSPEKKLAAAVFVSGLVEIRNHVHNPAKRKQVEKELAWVFSDDTDWPYSFVRLCELFQLHPDYVRRIVSEWLSAQPSRRRMCSTHRHAA